jgi:Na+-driven multidrug efflux pump
MLMLGYIFARHIVALFTQSPEATEIAVRMLHIVLWSTLLFGCSAVVSGVMRSSGTVIIPTLLSISAIVLVEVPVGWFMSSRIGIDGVWMAYPAAFMTMLLLQVGFYRLVWRKRRIRKLI